MGALTDNRKRFFTDPCSPSPFSSCPLKKSKLCAPQNLNPEERPQFLRLPIIASLHRTVHCPQRIVRVFHRGISAPESFLSREREFLMGNTVSWISKGAIPMLESLWSSHKCVETPETPQKSSKSGLDLQEYKKMVSSAKDDRPVMASAPKFDQKTPLKIALPAVEPSPTKEAFVDAKRTPLYKDLLASAKKRGDRLNTLEVEVQLIEKKISELREMSGDRQKDLSGPFRPLTRGEENAVNLALPDSDGFWAKKHEVLVIHEGSNIEITREAIQCLRECAWLNDEVINLYFELLKERERREPDKFLRCHFFNTFFYKKLTGGKNTYDFKAVRRWTSKRKLGYSLIECDKIFVPIHKEVHWCLAVIDVKDKKFIYLDSLGGMDDYPLQILARYIVDEVKDKSNEIIDAYSWDQGTIDNLPLQENGWDCGMFMVKYAGFFSRGLTLQFKQDDMEYFRRRTAIEILNLRAD